MVPEDPKTAAAGGRTEPPKAPRPRRRRPVKPVEPPITAPELDWTEEDDAIADAVAEEMETRRRRAMGLP